MPKVEPKRPKLYKEVSGEVSTKLNSNVTVLPSGEVIVSMINEKFPSTKTFKPNDSEDDGTVSDDEEAENNEVEEKETKATVNKKKGKKVKRKLKKIDGNAVKTKGNKKAKKEK